MRDRDRRRSPRQVPGAGDARGHLRIRAGRELTVIDVAAGGALVESSGRLLPGTHVDVHVNGAAGRELVRSRVVRAYVHALSAERILYRGALAFERFVDLGGDQAAFSATSGVARDAGTGYPAASLDSAGAC